MAEEERKEGEEEQPIIEEAEREFLPVEKWFIIISLIAGVVLFFILAFTVGELG